MTPGIRQVLLVDDDSGLLDALPAMMHLRVENIAIETCGSAKAALEKLAYTDYDAVITDIKMPGMDGLRLLQEVSALQPQTPVLLITGHGEHDLSVQALRGGAFDFISKPIDRDYFAAALERALGVRSLRRELSQRNAELERYARDLEAEVARRTAELTRSHAEKAELGAIVDSSDDGIISKDLDGIVKSWNPAAERIFGYTASEMIGRSITAIMPLDRGHEEDEVLSRVLRGESVEHFETVRMRSDGSPIDVSLTISPVRDESGVIVGVSKIARDISARIAAERAVRESTLVKDEFLSLVSHELRTPIAVITGNADVLVRRIDEMSPTDRDQALADIAFEAERLQRIIENLLLLTRVEGGEPLQIEHMRLDRVIETALGVVRRRRPDRVFTLHSAETVLALGDPTLTSLVVENLVGNADKYSPNGEPIDVCLSVRNGSQALVRILDRGIGVASSEIAEVFAPFFRAAAARERFGGMGLGLAICKKAVEEQGGEIGAAPRDGGGSEFWFTLPLSEEPEFA